MSEPARAASVTSTARSAPRASALVSTRWADSGPMHTATISPTSAPRSRIRIASSSACTSNGFGSESPDRSSRLVAWIEPPVRRRARHLLDADCDVHPRSLLDPGSPADYLPMNDALPLLDEGVQALAGVVGREHQRVQVGLVDEVAADVAVQRPVGRLLGVVQRDRALGGHLGGHAPRRRHQLVRRVDVLDEAALERLVGVDHAPGQDQLLGVADVGRPGQALARAPAGDDAEVDLGLAELGVLATRAARRRRAPSRSRRRARSRSPPRSSACASSRACGRSPGRARSTPAPRAASCRPSP